MSNYAYIKDISSLNELGISIARFCEENENQLLSIELKLQSKFEILKLQESKFMKMIELAQDDLKNANYSLSCCESNSYEDNEGNEIEPDCNYEFEERMSCEERLELVENNYNSFRKEIRNLEISISEYQIQKIKYSNIIQFTREVSTSCLSQLINGAEDYLVISSPFDNSFSNGLGLAEAISIIDPTMVVAATVDAGEIIMMSVFYFLGFDGSLFTVSNANKEGLISTTFSENGVDYICSELKIEKRETGNLGKIRSVNIPPSLEKEKIGKHLINNMEAICRANNCREISGWAKSTNVDFYKTLNYQKRNEIKGTGAEVFKLLESFFLNVQKEAVAEFLNINNAGFINNKNWVKQQVNPLNIISPEEMYDKYFWEQHGENQNRYLDLIEKYGCCNQELESGKTLDQIRKENMWLANAYDIFHGSESLRLLKSGDYYCIDSNGRHRVAAAQIYYMLTGKTIYLAAEVLEKI